LLGKFTGNSLIYALAMFLNRGIAFLLLPIYTRHLTPADYGVVALCSSYSGIAAATVTVGLCAAVSLFYYKLPAEEYQKLLRTVWLCYLVLPLLGGLVLELVGTFIQDRVALVVPWDPYLRLATWAAFLAVALEVPLALFQVEQRAAASAVLTVFSFLATTGLLLYFVAVRGEGAFGSLCGQAVAGLLIAAVSHALLWRRCRRPPALDLRYLGLALKLCAPALPYMFFLWVLNVSDRWILGRYVPVAEVGIYNLAYTLGMIVSAVGLALASAFMPIYYRNAADAAFRPRLRKLLAVYLLALTWVTLAVSVAANEVLRVMTAPAYHGAAPLVPWIAAGYWAYGGLYLTALAVLQHRHQTGWLLLIAGAPALVNLGLNWLLIPRFGTTAAAATTLVAFLLMAGLALGIAWRLDRLPYSWIRLAAMSAVAAAAYWVGATWLTFGDLGAAILAKGALLAAAGLLMGRAAGFTIPAVRQTRAQMVVGEGV
jgi:O-antigen/teichoic acid export membrane protein